MTESVASVPGFASESITGQLPSLHSAKHLHLFESWRLRRVVELNYFCCVMSP